MTERVIGGILWKKVFLKILQNLQETLVPEKTPVNFAEFLRTPFLQNNSHWLKKQTLKCGHCKNKRREKYSLCCREVDAMFTTSAKIPQHEGRILLSDYGSHFWFLVELNETRRLGEAKVYLFVPGVNQLEWGRETSPRFPFVTPGVWRLPLRPTAYQVV